MKSKSLIFIFLLFVFSSSKTFSCDCIPFTLKELQKISYEDSELIFVADAKLLDRRNGAFKLIILEQFKGKSKSDTLEIIPNNSCSLFLESGRWLIYADVTDDGTILVADCGPTRSFRDPHLVGVKDYDRYPPTRGELKSGSEEVDYSLRAAKHELKLREKAIQDLEEEIKWLREKNGNK